MIRDAAQRNPQLPRDEERWWRHLIDIFGTEETMFETTNVPRRVFNEALALISDVPLETRGRRSAIRTNRERLLFLLIYLAKGVKLLESLVVKFIKKREQVQKLARKIAKKYRPNNTQAKLRFWNEEHPDAPEAARIVDCTVVQIR